MHDDASELRRIPLVLSGAWTSADRTLWIATASCDEALVCVSFQVANGNADWAKSPRLASDGEAVRIGLGLHPADQQSVTIGCGAVARPIRLNAAGARPQLAEKIAIETGRISQLGRLDGIPAMEWHLLFLACCDVRFGRNWLWRLHPSLVPDVGQALRAVLDGGRSGTCAWPLAGSAP